MSRDAVLAFCGSFSPPTNGHLHAAVAGINCLTASGYHVIRALIIPVHGSYGKPGMLPDNLRLDMCRLLAGANDLLEVDDVELRKNSWSPTVDTLGEVLARFPAARVFLLCAIDIIESFVKAWRRRDIERILTDFGIVVMPRGGTVITDLANHCPWFIGRSLENVVVVGENPMGGVSSTLVRARIRAGQDVAGLMPPAVEAYVRERGLFTGGDDGAVNHCG
jgi:nicotinate (nicotinamide) nucleotide adenylyltransferase